MESLSQSGKSAKSGQSFSILKEFERCMRWHLSRGVRLIRSSIITAQNVFPRSRPEPAGYGWLPS